MRTQKLSRKNQEKYQKTLKIAYQLFLRNGYEKTSLQMIIRELGGSLATIYKLFGDKKNLFQKVIEQENRIFFQELEKCLMQAQQSQVCLEDFLVLASTKLLTEIFTPEAIALNRLIFIEGYDNPDLLKTFRVSCVEKILLYFAKNLESYAIKENITLLDPQESAQVCLDLIINPYLLHSLLDSNYIPPSPQEIEKISKKNAKIFLLYLKHLKEIQ